MDVEVAVRLIYYVGEAVPVSVVFFVFYWYFSSLSFPQFHMLDVADILSFKLRKYIIDDFCEFYYVSNQYIGSPYIAALIFMIFNLKIIKNYEKL